MDIPKENFIGKTVSTRIGATPEQGGTRGYSLEVGGAEGLPFHSFESQVRNVPKIGMDVVDTTRVIDDKLKEMMGEIISDPVNWAKICESEWGADFVVMKLLSANPEEENRSPEECASLVKEVLKAVKLPIMVYGSGNYEADAKLMEEVSMAAAGERIFIGLAEEDNYKSLAAAAMSNGHGLVGFSNLDINLAKQIAILLMDYGVKHEDILIDPLQAALGVGLEYTYSVVERLRQGALMGDNSLQTSIICDCSVAMGAREALENGDGMGDTAKRAVNWEVITAESSLIAGADLLIVRHPESVKTIKTAIASLTGGA